VPADDGFELLAASLRADATELTTAVAVLAGKLEAALPQRTRVERERRMFSSARPVRSLSVTLGQDCFTLRVRDGRVEGAREKQVGGVTIRREALDPGMWLTALTDALAREAEHSEQARTALERLLG
jgi:hypothetical protein